MHHTLKLTQIGNSVGAIFPKELLTAMKLAKGDQFFLTETPDGYRLSAYNPELETQMNTAEEIMKRRRNVLRELAK